MYVPTNSRLHSLYARCSTPADCISLRIQVVKKYGIRGHITTVTMEEGVDFPSLYWDDHLKGRLVLKL